MSYPPGTHVPIGDSLNNFHRPPLANELFADRPVFAEAILRFPECEPIVPQLRALKGGSLEAVLQDLQSKAKDYPRGLQQLAAVRYYLQSVLWQCGDAWRGVVKGVTNYKSLLDLIERGNKSNEPVCLVTFNYDTLIEDALADFGLPITALPDYTKKHPFYRVFKVHGSVNWARILENKIQSQNPYDSYSVARSWIQRATELSFTHNYVLFPGYPAAVVEGRPAFPAIAIPVEREKDFECPPEMIDELKALLPQTTKVLVIGWRATEQHFLDLLRLHIGRGIDLYVVAGAKKDAEDARVSICRALLNSTPSSILESGGGFTDFILSGAAEKYLAA